MIPDAIPLDHLVALSDERGVFEHARYAVPRLEHGYCLDDVARALVVTSREEERSDAATRLAGSCLDFVDGAVLPDGRAHNRRAADGRWTDQPGADDCWGRALWGLGVAATRCPDPVRRTRALSVFHRAASLVAPDSRARRRAFRALGVPPLSIRTLAFGALGAAAIVDAGRDDAAALGILRLAAVRITAARSALWDWPEDRLHYANAVIPEALIAAGRALGDDGLVARGLELLRFLVEIERRPDGPLSVTPVSGRGPADRGAAFDQQPIEIAAIAEACARAFDVTGDRQWLGPLHAAWAWFEGENDSGAPMFDAASGAGYDGLTPGGRNENRGAESTLAALSTLQCARRLLPADVMAGSRSGWTAGRSDAIG